MLFSPLTRWLTPATATNLKIFTNEPIPVQNAVASNGWRIQEEETLVARDGLKLLIGRDHCNSVVNSVTQTLHFTNENLMRKFKLTLEVNIE